MSTQPVTKAEWVYAMLRDRITSGELRPGERLRLDPIARELATSSMPVREALRMLQRDGLVTIESHRGATVADLSWGRVYEAVVVRMHLEVLATRTAAPHHNQESVAGLERLLGRMDSSATKPSPTRFTEANRRFHTSIYERCPNTILRAEIQSLWDTVWRTRSRSLFGLDPSRMRAAHDEHRDIVDALRRRDPERAERAADRHRVRTLQSWAKAIEAFTGANGGGE